MLNKDEIKINSFHCMRFSSNMATDENTLMTIRLLVAPTWKQIIYSDLNILSLPGNDHFMPIVVIKTYWRNCHRKIACQCNEYG